MTAAQVTLLNDDRVGRALDELFYADRASLLTEVVVRAVREFGVDRQQLHNDSRIEGVRSLSGAEHRVIPDRIETGTLLAAAGGRVRLTGVAPATHDATLEKLREAGARLSATVDSIGIEMSGRPAAVSVRTAPYPGFATDMRAQVMALDCIARGTAVITETIFENRYMHALELQRLGAEIASRATVPWSRTSSGCRAPG